MEKRPTRADTGVTTQNSPEGLRFRRCSLYSYSALLLRFTTLIYYSALLLAFSEVLAVFRRGASSITCPTCEGVSSVLALLDKFDALRACSRCRAMFVEPPRDVRMGMDIRVMAC